MLWTDFVTAREVEDVAKYFMLCLMRHDRNSLPPLAAVVLFDLQSKFPAFLPQKDKANAQEAMIESALELAYTNGFSWCIRTLPKHGADINAPGGRRYEKKNYKQHAGPALERGANPNWIDDKFMQHVALEREDFTL